MSDTQITTKAPVPLIPIHKIDGEDRVYGRDLHEFLQIETPYTKWFERMREYGFEEGEDFLTILSESTGGRRSTDHVLTIDMGKELGMIQRTDLGRRIRRYFIEVEKWAAAQTSLPVAPHRAPEVLSLKDQAAVLRTLRSSLQPDYADAKARVLLARAMNEEPEIDPAKRPLDVQEYLESRDVPAALILQYRSTFGTAVSRLYVEEFGERAKKVDRFVNGKPVKVRGYTEEHRHLFDRAFSNHREFSKLATGSSTGKSLHGENMLGIEGI